MRTRINLSFSLDVRLAVVVVVLGLLSLNTLAADKTKASDSAKAKPSNQFGVELGDSLRVCREKIHQQEVSAKEFLSQYPFTNLFCFLRTETTVVWSDEKPRADGWPIYVIGVFSDATKTKLTDFLRIGDGHKFALIKGDYANALVSLKKGMTVEQMFALVGKHDCEYTRNSDGKWIVRFWSYQGFHGRQYVVEADAATGVILNAYDGTI